MLHASAEKRKVRHKHLQYAITAITVRSLLAVTIPHASCLCLCLSTRASKCYAGAWRWRGEGRAGLGRAEMGWAAAAAPSCLFRTWGPRTITIDLLQLPSICPCQSAKQRVACLACDCRMHAHDTFFMKSIIVQNEIHPKNPSGTINCIR